MIKKNVKIALWLFAFAMGQLLISCNTSVEIAKRHYQSGYYVNIHKKHNDVKPLASASRHQENIHHVKSISSQLVSNSSSDVESLQPINEDKQIASLDNATPIILDTKIDFTKPQNSIIASETSSSIQQVMNNKSYGGGDSGHYLNRWLIYLGLAILAVILASLLYGGTELGFSYLLYVMGVVLLLLAIIYFIKWLSML